MSSAGMDLRGWEYTGDSVEKNYTCSVVLGLKWHRDKDPLQINLDGLPEYFENVTKRVILSTVHRIFDPIGYLSPITVCPKMLLQEMWSSRLGWDEAVTEETKRRFLGWLEEVKLLESLQIPRWLTRSESDPSTWSLHVFCDASRIAYATAIFLRTVTKEGVNVQLIQAKSRVAPLKPATIPRLELLAATIGARLAAEIKKEMGDTVPVTYWTDSSTVLAWISRNEPWNLFVSNRIKEIRELTDPDKWRHVAGKENPADLPSRGCRARQLLQVKWWEGPSWLKKEPKNWPTSKSSCNEEEIARERKKTAVTALVVQDHNWITQYFSDYERILRSTAWVLRFIRNCRLQEEQREERKIGNLTVGELEDAEKQLLKHVQKSLDEKIDLAALSVYTDEDGIMRLKTKLTNREDTNSFRHPIVLPARHPVIKSLIIQKHKRMGHAGTQLVLNALREHYWLIRGRKAVRDVCRKCTTCRRYEAKYLDISPGLLPKERVGNTLAFEIIGTDFAGPLYLKDGKKCWICLFTCAVYRAVHLELAMSLSTESFLLALRRFIARRGRPRIIYSDNGTNYLGAVNLLDSLDWEKIKEYATVQRIHWRFNPPTASWWGGWWERLIRLLKNLLKRILGKARLWYEELLTILLDCEATMNTRPLTYVSDSEPEFQPITPIMFLNEIAQANVPDLDEIDGDSLNKRLRYRQKLRDDIRTRFRSEYLGLLIQPRSKKETRSIKRGEVVLVGSENSKRLDWPLALVLDILPGKDGVGRVVRLRTARGEIIRPIQRVFPLEVFSDDSILQASKTSQTVDEDVHPKIDETKELIETRDDVESSYRTRSGRTIRPPLKLKD